MKPASAGQVGVKLERSWMAPRKWRVLASGVLSYGEAWRVAVPKMVRETERTEMSRGSGMVMRCCSVWASSGWFTEASCTCRPCASTPEMAKCVGWRVRWEEETSVKAEREVRWGRESVMVAGSV